MKICNYLTQPNLVMLVSIVFRAPGYPGHCGEDSGDSVANSDMYVTADFPAGRDTITRRVSNKFPAPIPLGNLPSSVYNV